MKLSAALLVLAPAFAGSDPLPSWNDGASKQAVVAFVGKVTTKGSRCESNKQSSAPIASSNRAHRSSKSSPTIS